MLIVAPEHTKINFNFYMGAKFESFRMVPSQPSYAVYVTSDTVLGVTTIRSQESYNIQKLFTIVELPCSVSMRGITSLIIPTRHLELNRREVSLRSFRKVLASYGRSGLGSLQGTSKYRTLAHAYIIQLANDPQLRSPGSAEDL
jgi:hypothetical protein